MELMHETVNCIELFRQFRQRAFMEQNVTEEAKILTCLVEMLNSMTLMIMSLNTGRIQ